MGFQEQHTKTCIKSDYATTGLKVHLGKGGGLGRPINSVDYNQAITKQSKLNKSPLNS